MNLLRLLMCLMLPALALGYSAPTFGLTPEELKHLKGDPAATHVVTFDLRVYKSAEEYNDIGQMKFALFGETLPLTVKAFINTAKMERYGYTGSVISRVVKDMIFQGGYLRRVDYKEYDPLPFDKYPQENFQVRHNKPGRISLASTGGDTNGVSFFISIAETTTFFDQKYVAFGQLVDGFPLINVINNIPTDDEAPMHEIVITKVVVTDSTIPVVVYIGAVTKKYPYSIYGIISLTVLAILWRLTRRRSLINFRVFKS